MHAEVCVTDIREKDVPSVDVQDPVHCTLLAWDLANSQTPDRS